MRNCLIRLTRMYTITHVHKIVKCVAAARRGEPFLSKLMNVWLMVYYPRQFWSLDKKSISNKLLNRLRLQKWHFVIENVPCYCITNFYWINFFKIYNLIDCKQRKKIVFGWCSEYIKIPDKSLATNTNLTLKHNL